VNFFLYTKNNLTFNTKKKEMETVREGILLRINFSNGNIGYDAVLYSRDNFVPIKQLYSKLNNCLNRSIYDVSSVDLVSIDIEPNENEINGFIIEKKNSITLALTNSLNLNHSSTNVKKFKFKKNITKLTKGISSKKMAGHVIRHFNANETMKRIDVSAGDKKKRKIIDLPLEMEIFKNLFKKHQFPFELIDGVLQFLGYVLRIYLNEPSIVWATPDDLTGTIDEASLKTTSIIKEAYYKYEWGSGLYYYGIFPTSLVIRGRRNKMRHLEFTEFPESIKDPFITKWLKEFQIPPIKKIVVFGPAMLLSTKHFPVFKEKRVKQCRFFGCYTIDDLIFFKLKNVESIFFKHNDQITGVDTFVGKQRKGKTTINVMDPMSSPVTFSKHQIDCNFYKRLKKSLIAFEKLEKLKNFRGYHCGTRILKAWPYTHVQRLKQKKLNLKI